MSKIPSTQYSKIDNICCCIFIGLKAGLKIFQCNRVNMCSNFIWLAMTINKQTVNARADESEVF